MIELTFGSTLLILIVTAYFFWKNWNYKVLMHPGFYFLLVWIIAVPSQWYLMQLGYSSLPHPSYVDELNFYVAFTAVSFLLWNFRGAKFQNLKPELQIIKSLSFFKIAVIIVFSSYLLEFMFSGASLNVGINRTGGHLGRSSILSILRSARFILEFMAGFYIGKKFLKQKTPIKYFYLLMPLMGAILLSIQGGGRNPMLIALKAYSLGFGFSLPVYLNYQIKTKIIVLSVSAIVISGIVFSLWDLQRKSVRGFTVREYDSRLVESFSGPMEYMGAHYYGYQLRRAEWDGQLNYGTNTFYGFLDIRVPFSNAIGLGRSSLGSALGVEDYRLEVYYSGLPGSYTTWTNYIQMIRDFGENGALLFIFLFTLYTHKLFLYRLKYGFKSGISIIPYYLCFYYWANSNFYSFYGFNIVNSTIIPFFLFDLLQRLYMSYFVTRQTNPVVS